MAEKNTTYVVSGVCCASEEGVLRKRLDGELGADVYRFNLVSGELLVSGNVPSGAVRGAVRRAGFGVREKQAPADQEAFVRRHRDGLFAAAAALLWLAGVLLGGNRGDVPGESLLAAAVALGGWKIFWRGWIAVRNRVLDMNVLMTAAVLGAVMIGRWSEAVAVVVLFALALMLEEYSTVRSRRAVQSLLTLAPRQATLLKDDREVVVDAEAVAPGEVIVVRPGERIALDGIVQEGLSTVNEAAITGEALPAAKRPGSTVYAGGVNERGRLRIRTTCRYEDTMLAHILHLIEEAQHQRAPVQTSVDRFAQIYTPAVFALAVLVAVLPPLVLGLSWDEWLYRALVLLVIACPCALVISTPVTLVSAMTNAARRGILVKGGKSIEELGRVRSVAFDKTGTLTEGRPEVTDVVPLNSMNRGEVLRIVAAMEHQSEHHLASAVLAEAARAGIDHHLLSVEGFEALPGLGLRAQIGGTTWFLGNERLGEEHGFLTSRARELAGRFRDEGKSTMILGRDREAVSILAVRDTARRQSREAIGRLKALGVEETRLLSGDHEVSVEALARELSIDSARGRLLPEEKVHAVQEMKRRYGSVAMVGDGINDAPALAAATVGIAMGVAGSDAAMETADVVLMADDLSRLPHLIALSRKTMAIVRQNVVFALGVKFSFLILSLMGFSTLWMALLADDGAALAVIVNGLRTLTFKEPT
jgi:Cd2+/Zn2+-exporting ATPase